MSEMSSGSSGSIPTIYFQPFASQISAISPARFSVATLTMTGCFFVPSFAIISSHLDCERQRSPSRRLRRVVVERLVQLFHFAWSRRLSPENWCLGVENGVFFSFWGHFGVFLAFWGAKLVLFSHFFRNGTLPQGR